MKRNMREVHRRPNAPPNYQTAYNLIQSTTTTTTTFAVAKESQKMRDNARE